MESSVTTHHLAKHTALWISSHFPPKFLDTHRPFWKIINDLSKFQLCPVQLLVWPLIIHIQSFRTVKTHNEVPSKLPELHRHTHGLWGPFGILEVQSNNAYDVPTMCQALYQTCFGDTKTNKIYSLLPRNSQFKEGSKWEESLIQCG